MKTTRTSLQNQNGYIGIVVLLIMVVILGIGLSIARRSSQDIEITTQEESATRVFNSAETGVNEALSSILEAEEAGTLDNLSPGETRTITDNNSNVEYTITTDNTFELTVEERGVVEIPLDSSSISAGDTLDIKWSKIPCDQDPATLMVSAYHTGPGGRTYARHYGYNVNGASSGGCDRGNNFEDAGSTLITSPPDGYYGSLQFPLTTNDLFLRISTVYKDAMIKVDSDSFIESSQFTVVSQATNETTSDGETKAIEVKRGRNTAPSFMDFALASGSDIVK